MDTRLEFLAQTRGCFLRAEVHDAGYSDRDIVNLIRSGSWHRVRPGAYTFTGSWQASDSLQRHRVLCAAVLASYGDKVALAHVSALVHHGIAVHGVDLTRAHVVRLDGGASRVERDVVHHRGALGLLDIADESDVAVCAVAPSLIQTAMTASTPNSLVSFDSALHRKLVSEDDLCAVYQRMERWPSTRSVKLVLRLADGRAESPGESIGRYLCFATAIPKPELQYPVYDVDGTLIGYTDFAWDGLLGEFDGKVKYGRLLKPGQNASDVVFAEKVREDRLREATGFSMIRYIWSDYSDARGFERRTRRMLRMGRAASVAVY